MALCLQSTHDASLALLEQCAADMGRPVAPQVVFCNTAWAHFERGDMEAYAADIAAAVLARLARAPKPDCIVLAQASMQVAEGLLQSCGIPVISTPVAAAEHGIAVARGRMSLRP